MRVIAGSRRSIKLKTADGFSTRPTMDRTKETLFNILSPYLCDCSFLDLFSGSGGIGIEALSRGASLAVLVESDKRALACIKSNLAATRFLQEARVMPKDVLQALSILEKEGLSFDIIFMDPPFGKLLEREVLNYLKDSLLLQENTLIVVEASVETDFSYLDKMGYDIKQEKDYKSHKHLFLYLKSKKGVSE